MLKIDKMTFRSVCAMVAVVLGLTSASAQEFEKNILTGGPTGTYIQFGKDIAGLMGSCDQTLTVRESAGSLENFLGVRQRPSTQFGIVQSDVLEYLQTYSADDPAIARAIQGVRIAFPLYNEEVHILASKDINGLSDLSDKRIAIGVQDSGTFLTSSLILDLAEVETAETLTIGPDESFERLKAGEIDAFFYVAGAPTGLFSNADIDAEKFHLVPISDPVLQSVYTPAQIPAGTYDFQTEALDVVAVKAILMTYEFNPRQNSYHRNSCKAVSDVANRVFTQFSDLQDTGHPKWSQVDLTDIPPGWDVASCVNEGLSADYTLSCAGDAAAVETNDSNANAAYRARICELVGC